jgi:predicted PurR-regulated permease PerM
LIPPTKKPLLYFLGALSLAGVAASLYLVRDFLVILVSAPVLAIASYPIHARISRWVRSKAGAALLSTAAVSLLGVVPTGFLLAIAFEQGRGVAVRTAAFVQTGGIESLLTRIAPLLGRFGLPSVSTADIQAWLASHAEGLGRSGLSMAGSVAGSVAASAGSLLFVLFVLFFCFADGPALYRRMISLTPLSIRQANRLAGTVSDMIGANVNGVLSVGLAQGGLTGIAFAVAGLPSAVFWGMAAGVASILPPFGAAAVWLPGAIYLAATGEYWKGALLGLFGALIIASADNVIRPIVVGSKVQMGTLPILLSILGGLQTFGLIGLFLGPVVFAATAKVIQLLREEWN